ncbi:MAG: hypothetical protein ACRCT8_01710 [Lacipirellulaceae bacterium]
MLKSSKQPAKRLVDRSWIGVRLGLVLVAAALGFGTGCEEQFDPPSAPAPVAALTPEERFDAFMEALKRQIDNREIRGGAAVIAQGGDPSGPVTEWSTRVAHRLLPPKEAGAPYRAKLRIETISKVTMTLRAERDDDADQKSDRKENGADKAKEPATPGTAPGALFDDSPIRELPLERLSEYDFEFRDGEWVVLTELDHVKEPFTAAAIEYALERQ